MSGTFRKLCVAAASFCAAGCQNVSYPALPQHVPPQHAAARYRLRQVLEMGHPHDVPWASVVGGVLPPAEGADWSWTDAHPSFRFTLDPSDQPWQFEARLTEAGVVLDKTGPQTVAFLVNGEVIGKARLDHYGSFDVDFPVASATLRKRSPVDVEISIAPCLPATRGPRLCVLLHQIGFTRDLR